MTKGPSQSWAFWIECMVAIGFILVGSTAAALMGAFYSSDCTTCFRKKRDRLKRKPV